MTVADFTKILPQTSDIGSSELQKCYLLVESNYFL